MVSQNGLNSLLVTWTPSAGLAVTGYTIFYQEQDGGQSGSLEAEKTDSSVIITELMTGATYSIAVMANSNTLPSGVIAGPDQAIGNLSNTFS